MPERSAVALPLDRLQRWMLSVVASPEPLEQALEQPVARAEVEPQHLETVILPSPTLAASERLGIYHGMYLVRMEEALQSDYPALQHFLGHERFRELVRAYVTAHPSHSYTLNRLGDHLPGFLAEADVPRREFCRDLALLELAVTEVFDAPETPALTKAEIEAVPAAAWERARLRPVAALRLLALRYPVNVYVHSVRRNDHDHPRVRRRDEWLAVYRRDYAVYREELTRPAHALLAELVAGARLGDAIDAALKRSGRPRPEPDLLFGWFRAWIAGGLFRAVELDT